MKKDTNMHMTELEERLAAPGGRALRDELTQRLKAMEAALRARLAASVPRAEFAEISACAVAAQCAGEVLRDWPANP